MVESSLNVFAQTSGVVAVAVVPVTMIGPQLMRIGTMLVAPFAATEVGPHQLAVVRRGRGVAHL